MYQEWSSEDSSYLELLATRGAQEVFAVRVSQHMEPQLVRAAESLVTLCALINLLWMETAYVFLDLELQITEQWNWFKKEICVVKQSQKFLAKKKKGKKDSHLLWLQNKFIWTADILVTLSITGIAFAYFETALHFLKHSTFWGFSFKKILTRVHSEIQAPGKKYSVCNRSHRWGFKPVQHLTWIKSGKRFLQVGQVK